MGVQQARLSGDVPVLGPIGVGYATLGTTSAEVIGADAVRHGLIFHNPGSVIFRVTPANLTPVAGVGGIPVYPQSELPILGEELTDVNCAWNAVADSGANNPVTIFNFTDNYQGVPAPEPLARLNVGVPISSPLGIQISALTTASLSVIGANPVRRGILFSNPSDVPVAVCPANLTALFGAGSMIVLPGGEKRIMAKGRLRVNCGWKAIAESGAGKSLTILEFL